MQVGDTIVRVDGDDVYGNFLYLARGQQNPAHTHTKKKKFHDDSTCIPQLQTVTHAYSIDNGKNRQETSRIGRGSSRASWEHSSD